MLGKSARCHQYVTNCGFMKVSVLLSGKTRRLTSVRPKRYFFYNAFVALIDRHGRNVNHYASRRDKEKGRIAGV